MNIAIIGTGYVGLVVGAGFAETGNTVTCADIDSAKINTLTNGVIPIYEPGLEEVVKTNIREGRLSFTTDVARAVRENEIIFLALPTPQGEDGSADLSYVMQAGRDVARAMNDYKVIVTKSTVPVGTAHKLQEIFRAETKHDFDIVSNPEFLKEGAALEDFRKPDRIVVGTRSERAADAMRELYAPFVRTGNPIFIMNEESAEIAKYAANAFLAMKISFMNEIALLCDSVGADIDDVRTAIGTDERIGMKFLFAGAGYGGSCFPKDVRALSRTAQEYHHELKILAAVDDVNERQKHILAKKVIAHFGSLKGRVIAVWGLAFKPHTDDVREAPAQVVITELIKAGAHVRAHDPVANHSMARVLPASASLEYSKHAFDAITGADALVVVTEWNEFRRPNFEKMKSVMRSPVIFDGRNIYTPRKMHELGFTYYGIGRK